MSIKEKFSEVMGSTRVKVAAGLATASAALAPAAAFADEATGTVVSSMNTAFTGIVSDLTTALAGIAPIALGLLGIGLAISLGVKLFKKVTNKAV